MDVDELDLHTHLSNIKLEPGSVLVVRSNDEPDIDNALVFQQQVEKTGVPDVLVFFCTKDYELTALDEEMMATFGWQRIPGWKTPGRLVH